jgi:hypothetical protein
MVLGMTTHSPCDCPICREFPVFATAGQRLRAVAAIQAAATLVQERFDLPLPQRVELITHDVPMPVLERFALENRIPVQTRNGTTWVDFEQPLGAVTVHVVFYGPQRTVPPLRSFDAENTKVSFNGADLTAYVKDVKP